MYITHMHALTPHSPLRWLCRFPQLVSYQTLSSDVYEPVDVCVLQGGGGDVSTQRPLSCNG